MFQDVRITLSKLIKPCSVERTASRISRADGRTDGRLDRQAVERTDERTGGFTVSHMGPMMKRVTYGLTPQGAKAALRSKAAAMAQHAQQMDPVDPPVDPVVPPVDPPVVPPVVPPVRDWDLRRNGPDTQDWPNSYSLRPTAPWHPPPLRSLAVRMIGEIEQTPDGFL